MFLVSLRELGIGGLIHLCQHGREEESVPSESTEVWEQKVTLEGPQGRRVTGKAEASYAGDGAACSSVGNVAGEGW